MRVYTHTDPLTGIVTVFKALTDLCGAHGIGIDAARKGLGRRSPYTTRSGSIIQPAEVVPSKGKFRSYKAAKPRINPFKEGNVHAYKNDSGTSQARKTPSKAPI